MYIYIYAYIYYIYVPTSIIYYHIFHRQFFPQCECSGCYVFQGILSEIIPRTVKIITQESVVYILQYFFMYFFLATRVFWYSIWLPNGLVIIEFVSTCFSYFV